MVVRGILSHHLVLNCFPKKKHTLSFKKKKKKLLNQQLLTNKNWIK